MARRRPRGKRVGKKGKEDGRVQIKRVDAGGTGTRRDEERRLARLD